MAKLKIALLQLAPGASAEETVSKGLDACRQAKAAGADIALFPELWSHGYHFFDPGDADARDAWARSALPRDGAFVTRHRALASELDMAIGLGFLEATDGGPRNTFVLIDRSGEIALTYAKVHVCRHTLERYCEPGSDYPVADLDTANGVVTVGAMICYDREHPETARILGLRGAEILLVPNACILDDLRLAQVRVRAFENKVAIAMTNYPAAAGHSNGRSVGVSAVAFRMVRADGPPAPEAPEQSVPVDNLLFEAGPEAGVFMVEFDLDELRDYRARAVWGAPHRRPDTYADLVAPNTAADTRVDDPIS